MKIAVQLYSVRDHIDNGKDLLAILPKVKELGYDGVEFAGYFDLPADELRKALDDAGLVAVGTHTDIKNFKPRKLAETIEFCKTLGMTTMGMGGAPHDTPAKLRNTCKILKKAAPAAEEMGMKIYYHNHSDEFETNKDGVLPFDELKNSCYLEIDTYWSHHAGQDNYKLITENKERIVHLHIKDGLAGKPLALGEGDCDIAKVVKAAKEIGIEWLIVENDDPVPTGLEDIGRSIKYLKSLI